MVDIQIGGFPRWTEHEDLKWTVEECGFGSTGMKINWDSANPDNSIAEVRMPNYEAADAVVRRLHKFEFTPGYPLKARVKPGQNIVKGSKGTGKDKGDKGKDKGDKGKDKGDKGRDKGDKGKAAKSPAKGKGKYVKEEEAEPEPERKEEPLELDPEDPQFSIKNCIGAGRVEGWFLQPRSRVLQETWGHLQSYCFEGNLVYRPVNSPLLKDIHFKQKDPVSFEVMMVRGHAEAVRLSVAETDHLEQPKDAMIDVGDKAWGWEEADSTEWDENGMPIASNKSMKRRAREEADPRVLFFGGFGPEITEETLTKFAEQAGEVKKVKLFYHLDTWVSKGCGKVNYADLESAERAVNELAGTVLNERIVTVEPLGSNSSPNPNKKPRPPQPNRPIVPEDNVPKQLPLSMFSGNETAQEKLDMCYAAFDDLMNNHDPVATGNSMILMIRKLIMEVNDIFGDDEPSLKTWCNHLRQYPWFRENMQVVKWQESKRRVNISKASGNTEGYINHARNVSQMVEQRKVEQQIMGKALFEVSETEKARARRPPPPEKGKGKGAEKGGGGYYQMQW